MWQKLNKPGYIVNASFPKSGPVDFVLSQKFEFLQGLSVKSFYIAKIKYIAYDDIYLDTSHRFRQEYIKQEGDRERKKKKAKTLTPDLENAANGAIVCVADGYKPFQEQTILALREIYDEVIFFLCFVFVFVFKTNELTNENWREYVCGKKFLAESQDKEIKPKTLAFANYLLTEVLPLRRERTFDLKLPFDEFEFAQSHIEFLFHELNIQISKVHIQKVLSFVFALIKHSNLQQQKMVCFSQESDSKTEQALRDKTNPGRPAVKYIYEQ
ncbi:hypothetical protein RFI_13878 [Reticulomyxa filosa]|uniref:Uncharacterized protein n=1 Tax=Reticulomyxa filosa TaxID=46433 RepID=X6NBZ2_RETFI|nr:hypothetical protein RFI_13878 [Reticulomyxa filosa]|eukprot:ETO23304.1 hypothetical protein RFI_13878 [Reticulomyxa filosa]